MAPTDPPAGDDQVKHRPEKLEPTPDAKLVYNDYYNYHPVRQQAIYDMLSGLIADGVPIDGVGLQCHLNIEPQEFRSTLVDTERPCVS